ncbi:MAG: hypothetical protein U9O87_05050 [Verrucomicrobiota bacterium]|nr:hypothetical protein [Verrucomicrobiota bacterium]
MKYSFEKIFIVLFLLIIPDLFSENTQWYRGAFRLNSSVSSGGETIDTIARKAVKTDLNFIVITDQFLVRAEYGFPPLRNLFKVIKTRPSIKTYGIERYLNKIKSAEKNNPSVTIVSGADIAPHYFWEGSIFSENLTCRQFSEQMTVFGASSPEFYRKLPVIHNEYRFESFADVLLRLSPLLLTIFGLLLLFYKKSYYSDAQGHNYYRTNKFKIFAGIIFSITGLLWSLNNEPFTQKLGENQYATNAGTKPYKKVINYVNKNKNAGIVWSAPEATMKMELFGVKILTIPYIDDVQKTDSHNGFAGIYGDTSTAHYPGKMWDKMLLEYCNGKRKVLPTIIGESDYHGKGIREIGHIQTVIYAKKCTEKNIVSAIKKGKSYALQTTKNKYIQLENVLLQQGQAVAKIGETMQVDASWPIKFTISGKIVSDEKINKKYPAKLTIVVDGKIQIDEYVNISGNFKWQYFMHIAGNDLKKHYLRFYIKTTDAGWLLANPIFYKL